MSYAAAAGKVVGLSRILVQSQGCGGLPLREQEREPRCSPPANAHTHPRHLFLTLLPTRTTHNATQMRQSLRRNQNLPNARGRASVCEAHWQPRKRRPGGQTPPVYPGGWWSSA